MAFVCEKCGAEFESQEELDAHVKSEHGAAPAGGGHICAVCGMESETQEELDAHVKSTHAA